MWRNIVLWRNADLRFAFGGFHSMTEGAAPKHRDEAVIVGCMLISLGVLCNDLILEHFLAPDQVWSAGTKMKVRIFDATLAGYGLALILLRNRFAPADASTRMARFRYRIKWAGLKLATVVFVVASLEVAAMVLVAMREAKLLSARDPIVRFSKDLGYELLPSTTHTSLRELEYRSLFKSSSRTDEFGRRIAPLDDLETRKNAMLFFGGSFTYGHGAKDDETMPYRVGKRAALYRPYNYGVPGYGPQQMLVKLRRGDLGDIESNGETILVYGFMPDHIRRVMGSMRKVSIFARHFPCFELDENDELVLRGSFAEARPRRARMYNLLVDEAVMKYSGIDIPVFVGNDDIELTARIVEAARDEFVARFQSERFYVLLWPVPAHERDLVDRFAARLGKSGVRVLDYSDLVDMADARYVFDRVYDGHPTPETHAVVADALARDLGIANADTTPTRAE